MGARMTLPKATQYLVDHDRGCTVYNGNTIIVFHRHKKIGELVGERGFTSGNELTVASLSVAKLAETTAD